MVMTSSNRAAHVKLAHDSQVVGGQIGIQHQFGNFVLGVEGTLTVASRMTMRRPPAPASGRPCRT